MLKTALNRAFWGSYGRFAWDRMDPTFRAILIKVVAGILKEKQVSFGEKVLDAGCGTGNYAISLAEEGFYVTGIDYSAGMLECAKSKVTVEHAERLNFQKLDMNKQLVFTDSDFDHIISISTLWTVADPKFTLSELTRVLKPGGTLVVMQVPKLSESIQKTIRTRIKYLDRITPIVVFLVAVKVLLERTRATKYWSPEELLAMMLTNKELKISYVDHGPPIFIVATKIKRHPSEETKI